MPEKMYVDKELLEFLYIECRLNSPEIGKMLKCSKGYIIDCLTKFDIPKRTSRESNIGQRRSDEARNNMSNAHKGIPLSEIHKNAILESKKDKPGSFKGKHHTEETIELLRIKNSGANNHNYGKHFSDEHKRKLSESNKKNVISEEHKHKISLANKGRHTLHKDKIIIDKELLIFLYTECEMNVSDISELLRCGRKPIYTNLHDHNIHTRDSSDRKGIKHPLFGKHLSDTHKKNLSKSHKGYIPSDITRKKLSEAGKNRRHTDETKRKMSLAALGTKNHNYGKHASEETKQKLRLKTSGKNNGRYGRPAPIGSGGGKGAFYTMPDGQQFWTRSTYERRVIECLVMNNIPFRYEPRRFELNNTTYTPDIYLENINTYFEIKGYLNNYYKDKYKEFVRKYPEIEIRMLFKDDIELIESLCNKNSLIAWQTLGKPMSEAVSCSA